jgi:hypothetical protein
MNIRRRHTSARRPWVTKAQRFPVKTVSKEGNWSGEFHRLIFTEQSPRLFELPQRLDRADLPAEAQQVLAHDLEEGNR